MFAPKSLLFVPGDRPDRFAKAFASPAEAVIIDLEDAVPAEGKDKARRAAAEWIEAGENLGRLFVRMNAPGTAAAIADLAMLFDRSASIAGLVIPKVEAAVVIVHLHSALGEKGFNPVLVPVIESARGLRLAGRIGRAPGVWGLALGPVDLATQLGARFDHQALRHLRLQISLGAAEAGVAAIDGPSLVIRDPEALAAEASDSASLGFCAKLCIHPDQAATVNAAFTPTADEIAFARRVIAADAEAKGAVFQLDGRMIDLPVVTGAHRVLARAGLVPN